MSDLLTIKDVAALLNCSEETATRRFKDAKGVIDLASGSPSRRRRYRVLRVPRSVVEKYVIARGGCITVPEPQGKPANSRRKQLTEDELAHDLATLATQHGEQARKTLEKISARARAMTFVPQKQWQDMVFISDEDDVGI